MHEVLFPGRGGGAGAYGAHVASGLHSCGIRERIKLFNGSVRIRYKYPAEQVCLKQQIQLTSWYCNKPLLINMLQPMHEPTPIPHVLNKKAE